MLDTCIRNSQRLARSTIRVGNHTISMQSGGSGPPLILLHGLAGSNRWWYRNLEPLAAVFQVYAPDIRGFGLSRSSAAFDLNGAADELIEWMDRIGVERAHVVGHSMGAYIAIDLAARFPAAIDRLALVCAAVRITAPDQQRARIPAHQSPVRLFNILPLLMTDLWRSKPGDVLAAMRVMVETNVEEWLRKIRAPSLVIWGEEDSMVPIEQGYRLASHLPGKELVVMKGAGHHPMWEQPELFNAELMQFLNRPPHDLGRARAPTSRAA